MLHTSSCGLEQPIVCLKELLQPSNAKTLVIQHLITITSDKNCYNTELWRLMRDTVIVSFIGSTTDSNAF